MDINGERYLRTGEVLTDQDIDELKTCDAIYPRRYWSPWHSAWHS